MAPNEKIRLMWIGAGLWHDPGFYEALEQRLGALHRVPRAQLRALQRELHVVLTRERRAHQFVLVPHHEHDLPAPGAAARVHHGLHHRTRGVAHRV